MTHHLLNKPPQHLSDLALTLEKGDDGIVITGRGHTVQNVTATGGTHGILFNGDSQEALIDNYRSSNPHDYGLYFAAGASGLPNAGHTIRDVAVTILEGQKGQHCVRAYATEGLVAVNWNLTHYGTYGGATGNFRQIRDSFFVGGKFEGRPGGIGPDKKDSELTYRCSGVTFHNFTFDMNGGFLSTWKDASPFVLWSGVSDVRFVKCSFIQRNAAKAHLRCEAAWKVRPAATGIVCDTCAFVGGAKRVDGGNPGGVSFVNC